ncbi:CAP-Gly domain-containing linker protein 1-like [Dreissena polymorpha]|uniref:CAP-Gly domain-containing linker protein 1-like n=1 Tax=Dreissena polymorpha TaxID=45954 RepID=UPI0022640309|nr:CAP-Gly domain-containing linker protein 1-like [Dreissena polymorpha]
MSGYYLSDEGIDDLPLSTSGEYLFDEGLDDVPLSTSGDQSAQIQELKNEICRLNKVVKQQKQVLDTTENNYRIMVRKLQDDLSAALKRIELPTERRKRTRDSLANEELDTPPATSEDQSTQIQDLIRYICTLEEAAEKQKLAFDTTKKDYEGIVKKLTDELTAALTREQLHKTPGEMKQKCEQAEHIISTEFDELVEKLEKTQIKVQQLENYMKEQLHKTPVKMKQKCEQAEHIISTEFDELVEKLEKAETKVQQLDNDMKVCNIHSQKEKELLQEELTRKKEEVRQLHQYTEVMENIHGILTATIQMLKQDSPKTDDDKVSLKKLIEEETKLKIESDIMNDQLQKSATVTDPLSETNQSRHFYERMSRGDFDEGMSSGNVNFDEGISRGNLMHTNIRSATSHYRADAFESDNDPTLKKISTEFPRVAEAFSKKDRKSEYNKTEQTVERATGEENLGHRPSDDIEMIAQECEIS